MNLQARLDQFRDDHPYDIDTQAKHLLATEDTELIQHVLALGLMTAKHRQRHLERNYIKNVGAAPQIHRVKAGRLIKPSKRMEQLTKQLIFDVWRINGELKLGDASANDLTVAINRERRSAHGHELNIEFYESLKAKLEDGEIVRDKWSEKTIRARIKQVYGEFRRTEAA